MRGHLRASLIAAGLMLLLPAAASAEETLTFRYGPIRIEPYQVNLKEVVYGIPKPTVDGFVTGMEASIVDGSGAAMDVRRVMLHHVVFGNVGRRVGDRRDTTCDRFTLLDSETQVPAVAERFFGVGEERVSGHLPDGYGYPVKGDDQWAMTWMLMNHRNTPDSVYIQYRVTYETARDLTPVTPVWLDVRNCRYDAIFDVPGGGGRGATYSTSTTWSAPWSGRIVAALGHLHGGGKSVVLRQPDCGNREVVRSEPLWGRPTDPEYKVRPLLHEPGPINMSLLTSRQGYPLAAGQRLELTATYDNQLPHTRVMGIMGLYVARDPTVSDGCGALPGDVQVARGSRPGRTATPLVGVPLNGRRPDGTVRPMMRPRGGATALRSGSPIDVRSFSFGPANAVVRRGALLRWRFWGDTLHNVTLASGPEGFSSDNLSRRRTFERRLNKPGIYRLHCSLHPVDMAATVRVLRGRRR